MSEIFKGGLPVTRPLRIYRGDTKRIVYRWGTRPLNSQTVTYRDLSGATGVLVIRNAATRAELVRLTTGGGGLTLNLDLAGNPANGWIIGTLTDGQAATLSEAVITGDAQITLANGDTVTPVRWSGQVEQDDTNA